MRVEAKITIIILSFFAAFVVVTLAVVLTSGYKYNELEINDIGVFEEILRDDLLFDEKLFLLTPKFVVNSKLSKLGYIVDYSVQRKFPNILTINVDLDEVVWCSNELLIYDDYSVEKSTALLSQCNDIPKVVNLPNGQVNLYELVESFSQSDNLVSQLVSEIIFIDDETLSLIMSDGITVYLTIKEDRTISDYLNNYFNS